MTGKETLVKCIECKKLKSHGKISSPYGVPKEEPIPIFICMEWPAPIENPIMAKKEIETPHRCEFYERK